MISVRKHSTPAVRSLPNRHAHTRLAASSRISARHHVSATHRRDDGNVDQIVDNASTITPTLDAPTIRRRSSAGERCWGAYRPNPWKTATHIAEAIAAAVRRLVASSKGTEATSEDTRSATRIHAA